MILIGFREIILLFFPFGIESNDDYLCLSYLFWSFQERFQENFIRECKGLHIYCGSAKLVGVIVLFEICKCHEFEEQRFE